MKKIVTRILTIVALTTVVSGAAWAYFTDSERNSGNTFALGTVDIELDGDTSSGSAYFDISNMAPGDSVTRKVVVKNTGSLDVLFRGYLTNLTGTRELKNFLKAKLVLNPANVIGYTPRFDPVSDYEIYNDILANMVGAGTSDAMDNVPEAFVSDDQVLHPGDYAVYEVTITLPFDTPNRFQGASFSTDLVFEATQSDNQDPANPLW